MSSLYSAASHEPFHEKGIASQPVKQICACLGTSIQTLQEANAFAQKNLLRVGERWDNQESLPLRNAMVENKDVIIEQLRKVGMIDALAPERKEHTYALLMGALRSRVIERLTHLQELIDAGHSFKYIVLLGGMRPLIADEKVGLPATVTTEIEMMVHEYDRISACKDAALICVNAPMIQKADGTFVRPTTDTTPLSILQK